MEEIEERIEAIQKSFLKLTNIAGKMLRLIEELSIGHPNKVRIKRIINDCLHEFDEEENETS